MEVEVEVEVYGGVRVVPREKAECWHWAAGTHQQQQRHQHQHQQQQEGEQELELERKLLSNQLLQKLACRRRSEVVPTQLVAS